MTVRGKKQESVGVLHSGDIAVAAKLNQTHTGDVLTDKSAPVRFDPTPMSAHVIHRAVVARSKEDEDKIGIALHRQLEQDPTLYLHRESETHQTILSGMGEIQLDVVVSRLRTQAKIEVSLELPHDPSGRRLPGRPRGKANTRSKRAVVVNTGMFGFGWSPLRREKDSSLDGKWLVEWCRPSTKGRSKRDYVRHWNGESLVVIGPWTSGRFAMMARTMRSTAVTWLFKSLQARRSSSWPKKLPL
jgi:hypothetical protein